MKINLWSWIGKSFLNKTHKSLKKKGRKLDLNCGNLRTSVEDIFHKHNSQTISVHRELL